MFKTIAASSVIAFMMLGASSVAQAEPARAPTPAADHGNSGNGNSGGDHESRAPEPFTMIGLGVGAMGIVAARLRSRRSTPKP